MSRQKGKRQFGRIPYELANSGYLTKLTGRECRLLMALAVHMNGDWTARVGTARLAGVVGMNRRNVSRSLKSLEAKLEGRLQVTRSKGGRAKDGRGFANTYRFAVPEAEIKCAASDAVKRVASDAVEPAKCVISAQSSAPPVTHEQKQQQKKKSAHPHAEKKKLPDPFRQMTDLWCSLWATRYPGEKYPFARAKDAQAAKRVWEAVGEDLGKVERVFKAFLADADPFYEGHTLAMLSGAGVLPKFLTRSKPGQAGGDTAQDRASSKALGEIDQYMGDAPKKAKARTSGKDMAVA